MYTVRRNRSRADVLYQVEEPPQRSWLRCTVRFVLLDFDDEAILPFGEHVQLRERPYDTLIFRGDIMTEATAPALQSM